MDSAIIVALITGGMTLMGTIITYRQQSNKIDHKLEMQQALTTQKIDELTREVREHNNFARRVPVIEEQVRAANHRISDLEEINKHYK